VTVNFRRRKRHQETPAPKIRIRVEPPLEGRDLLVQEMTACLDLYHLRGPDPIEELRQRLRDLGYKEEGIEEIEEEAAKKSNWVKNSWVQECLERQGLEVHHITHIRRKRR